MRVLVRISTIDTLVWLAGFIFVLGSTNDLQAKPLAAGRVTMPETQRIFLTNYCVECHNEKRQEGKLRLDDISFEISKVEQADRWQKILNQLNAGEMPPEDAKQPDRDAKTEFLDVLAQTLVTARRTLSDGGGKITMRRLNRREYKNTIRDLLGVDINVRELPADGGAGTFDTVGSSLFMSSDQFEQYLALGRQALDEHFARYSPSQVARRMHVEAEDRNERIAKSLKDRVDAHERYVKWTTAVDAAAKKPENADVVAKNRDETKGGTHLYFQWQKIAGAPAPKEFGFVDAVNADEDGRRNWVHFVPYQRSYLEHPGIKSGAFLTIGDVFVNPYQPFRIPGDWPAGDYVVRVRIAATENTPKERHFVEFGPQHDSGVRAVASSHQVTGTMQNPQVLKIPLKFSPAKGHGFFLQEKGTYESEEVAHRLFSEGKQRTGIGPEFALWIDWIEVESVVRAKAPTIATKIEKLRKDPEQWANKYMPIYAQGYAEKYGRYQKWCAAIDEAAKKPENADIVKKLREDAKVKQSPHLFYSRYAKIKDAPPPTQFEFRDVDDAQFARSEYTYHFRYYDDYQKLPQRETGAWLMLYSLGRYTGIAASEKWPAGKYTLRVRLAASDESPQERRFIEIGTGKADAADFNVLSSHQVTGTLKEPQTLEIPVEINASGDRNFAIRDKRPNTRNAEYAMFREAWDKTGTGPRPCIWVDFVELEGPQNANAPATLALTQSLKLHIEPETQANKEVAASELAFEKSIERYRKWTAAVDEIAKLPEHAALVAELRELARVKAHPPAFYQFWAKRSPVPSPKDFGFPDGEEAEFQRGQYRKVNYVKDYLALPNKDTGAYLLVAQVHPLEKIEAPASWPPGDYVLRLRIAAVDGSPPERRFLQVGQIEPGIRSFSPLSAHQITGTVDQPITLEIPVTLPAKGNRSFALREKTDTKGEIAYGMWAETDIKTGGHGPKPALWIDWMEIEGPVAQQSALAKVTHIEPEKRRVDVERDHLRYKYLNEQYAKWKDAGGDEAKLKDFGFNDKSHAEFAKAVWDGNNRWFQQYLDWPLSKTGLYLDNTVNETSEYAIDMPADIGNGDYVMRVKIGRVPDMPAERAFLTFVEASPIDKDDRTFLANKQITATLDNPEIVELPFKVRPGGPRKFVLFEKRPLKKEGISLPGRTRLIKDTKQRDPVLWIDWIEYEGPLSAPASNSPPPIVFANTRGLNDRDHARAILERFATRAFRDQTPQPEYLDKLVKLFETRLQAGDKFDIAIREPLSVVLASPRFLYLAEPTDAKQPRKLTPQELATRLSYFLWSAPPDETLLALARTGELNKPEVLAAQVDRLINSRKSREFVTGFTHQWLGMDRLDFFQFNSQLYRDFDESTKAAARTEVFRTVEHVLRENRGVGDLLKSDYVVVNGLLGTYYGLEGVSGDEFRKVTVPPGSPRGGLLGMAAILAMGSNGEVSNPVERGAWVLRKLLHDPPPPAPANVPQLTRLEGKLLTSRERILAHQEQPQCASCHRKIDPIGFGLENFNAVGKWRTEDRYEKRGVGKKEWTIDPSGAFHKGPAFKDYFELRSIIAAKPEAFSRGLTEAIIEYALGRPYGFTDQPLADDMVQHAAKKDFALREFLHTLIQSQSFQNK